MTFKLLPSRLLTATVFIASLALPTWAAAQKPPQAVVTTEQVRAELMAHAPDGADPGKTVWVGLQLTHQPEWHTYWKNPGDSGLPTELTWTLPPGVTAGEIAWPAPEKIRIGTLANYGFEGAVLLPVPLTISPEFKPSLLQSDLPVKLNATWLVCRKECIPQDGEFSISIPVRSSTAINGAAFSAAEQAQPRPLQGISRVVVEGQQLKVSVSGLPAALQGQTLGLFPETPEVIETAAPWTQAWQGGVWTASVPLSNHRTQSPSVMPLVVTTEASPRQAFVTEAAVSGDWPAMAQPTGVSPALAAALQANAVATTAPSTLPLSLWAAVLGALLGGLILNLMPCVFPVLAIKVMSFTRHANDRRGHRISGLAYSAGVVLSFVALGALLLVLRSAGEQLGWGFQLQSPLVVAGMAALFTVLGLNLAGVFEFGNVLPNRWATLESKNPAVNAFLSGMLAVAIASPCTAPFMGASLGLALGLPVAQALLIFAAIGVGMALPYLAASLVPAVARALPRPGAWMDTFRRAMAFPMFATVVWLVWVLGQQSGINGAGALLALLVALALVIWSLTLGGRTRQVIATFSIAIAALLAWAIGSNVTQIAVPTTASASSDSWQAWAPGKVEQVLATGSPVFVDFTAAWCVTCQYNKRTTLADASVMADLNTRGVTLLRADWTRRDPAITAALNQLGRNGVPVYVLYSANNPPIVLSEILSVDDVRAALATL